MGEAARAAAVPMTERTAQQEVEAPRNYRVSLSRMTPEEQLSSHVSSPTLSCAPADDLFEVDQLFSPRTITLTATPVEFQHFASRKTEDMGNFCESNLCEVRNHA
ncbi:unnamed protein product [Amoebophrya sp. A120]|nr:unnamed protein product [Amoebophrya sp. A120]|eukprot:GSA120T00010280001.1